MRSHQVLLDHLRAMTGLEEPAVAKIVEEIHIWYDRDINEWLRSRHRELQRSGLQNRQIFRQLQEEAKRILVRPPELSERQIRRAIYG